MNFGRSILIWTSLHLVFGVPIYWEGKNRKNMRKIGEIGYVNLSFYFQFGVNRLRTDGDKNVESLDSIWCGIF